MQKSNIIKNFKPLFDRVLVQRIKPETITKSGIFLPETFSKNANNFFKAKVLSIGSGKIDRFSGKNLGCSVKPGDLVIVPEYGGANLKTILQEYEQGGSDTPDILIYKEEELLGVIED